MNLDAAYFLYVQQFDLTNCESGLSVNVVEKYWFHLKILAPPPEPQDTF